LYWVPDPELPLLYFLFLPFCLQTSTISRTVPHPPILRLSYVGIIIIHHLFILEEGDSLHTWPYLHLIWSRELRIHKTLS
jgi:hypothetical protein